MDGQLSLFGAFDTAERSLARKTDPRASHGAVPGKPKLTAIKALMLDVIGSRSLTANELAFFCETDSRNTTGTRSETYRKRCRELVNDGHFVVSGERECSFTGKVVAVYKRA